jgi:DMSO/TMAO reductase YedYZ molybdopterin-dependent catalytic subunit
MRPRAVDWMLLLLVATATVSGFGSFLAGRPDERWVFVLHGVTGLAIFLLLVWKLRRVWPRLVRPHLWDRATLVSLLALLAVLLVLATGLIWTTWQWPSVFPNGMWLHVALGLLLASALFLHMLARLKPIRLADLRGRRFALHFLAVWVVGGGLWLLQQQTNRVFMMPGARRRFTGSRQAHEDFPVTMWMFDNPLPLDMEYWRLRIYGAVAQPLQFTYPELAQHLTTAVEATLDCTSGWYTTQKWQGVAIAWLLDQAKADENAVAVSFHSATGYRWSLPLAEARQTILAAFVAGRPLTHGHGAPLRLVAPGRRGFQWVKWVTGVEVLTAPDYGEWMAIFASGLNRRPVQQQVEDRL